MSITFHLSSIGPKGAVKSKTSGPQENNQPSFLKLNLVKKIIYIGRFIAIYKKTFQTVLCTNKNCIFLSKKEMLCFFYEKGLTLEPAKHEYLY